MAAADYRLCDVCGVKTCYDAVLNYDDGHEGEGGEWLPQGVGDWAVICEECSKTHVCVVHPRLAGEKGGA